MGLRLVIDMVAQKLDNKVGFLKKLMHARPGRQNHFLTPIQAIEKVRADLSFLWLKRPASCRASII
ncbi:MAG: hypothetical protein HWN51_06230 [Desulfobacterales bacterium]|nr:hypothetical protein [Desulfobacterales bacterium]